MGKPFDIREQHPSAEPNLLGAEHASFHQAEDRPSGQAQQATGFVDGDQEAG
jgi:hypothetical protein